VQRVWKSQPFVTSWGSELFNVYIGGNETITVNTSIILLGTESNISVEFKATCIVARRQARTGSVINSPVQ
jgi:hypothetical protein